MLGVSQAAFDLLLNRYGREEKTCEMNVFRPNGPKQGARFTSLTNSYAPSARPLSGLRIFPASTPLSTTMLKNGNIISSHVMSP